METFLAIIATVGFLVGAAARQPLKRWYRKIKRRRGGIYLWRVRHHLHPTRRVNGYVGETVSFHFRRRQHMGTSNYPTTGSRTAVALKVPAQPWSDLDPVMHEIIRLPWWLCWKWVLRPLETLVMLCTWPVYNDAKNRWNPRRITRDRAKAQRRARDEGWSLVSSAAAGLGRAVRTVFQLAGVLMIAAGLLGWMMAR